MKHDAEHAESLAVVQQAMAEVIGELAWEFLVKNPMKVIERHGDGSTHRYATEMDALRHKKTGQ